MTKAVRIENADNNVSVKVIVTVQDAVYAQDANGQWSPTGEWKDVERQELGYPAHMSNGLYLTTSRRIIVTEEPTETKKAG